MVSVRLEQTIKMETNHSVMRIWLSFVTNVDLIWKGIEKTMHINSSIYGIGFDAFILF